MAPGLVSPKCMPPRPAGASSTTEMLLRPQRAAALRQLSPDSVGLAAPAGSLIISCSDAGRRAGAPSEPKPENLPCMTRPTRSSGTSLWRGRTPATANSSASRCPMTDSWKPKACPATAASACAACRICRSCHGSGSAVADRTSNCSAPRDYGAFMLSKCPVRVHSTSSGIFTKRSCSSSKVAAPPKCGRRARPSVTFLNGRRARCSRFRSTPITASSTQRVRRLCFYAAPRRQT
jgi:hypothetical protein